jgi:transcriptional regulator with XRE-family HTH domain
MARDPTPSNRIREAREHLGLTQAELGERIGLSDQQVARYEKNEARLTIQMIRRFAIALETTPAELVVGMPVMQGVASDVERAEVEGLPALSAAIATRGLRVYRVLQSSVTDTGITVGQIVTVDESDGAKQAVQTGDVVLAGFLGSPILLLRQYVAPATLITAMPGPNNSILRLDDRSTRAIIVGVVIRA